MHGVVFPLAQRCYKKVTSSAIHWLSKTSFAEKSGHSCDTARWFNSQELFVELRNTITNIVWLLMVFTIQPHACHLPNNSKMYIMHMVRRHSRYEVKVWDVDKTCGPLMPLTDCVVRTASLASLGLKHDPFLELLCMDKP